MTTWAPAPPRGYATRQDQLVRRALAAYWRGLSPGHARAFPVREWCRLESHFGREYVILCDGRELVAVYRVRAYDGVLKRLKRWPKTIRVMPR